ncbi:MAG: hypothetical protein WC592_08170 [Candidatus Omnitrophota bacterium]|nr:hypothetical protein [Candidatus Omnitrophota bacterium]
MRTNFLLIIIIALAALSGYAQDEQGLPASGPQEPQTESMTGRVDSIDWVGGTISMNGMTFSVPDGVKVVKGGSDIGFANLSVKDPVSITYYRDPSGALKVKNIFVYYGGDFPV